MEATIIKPFAIGEEFGSNAWREEMRGYGDVLKANGVRQMLFVHGTFVGDRPTGLMDVIDVLLSKIPESRLLPSKLLEPAKEAVQKHVKSSIDTLLGDIGNFSEEYAAKFGEAIGHDICGKNDRVIWGSGNYHESRLEGTLILADAIAGRVKEKSITDGERMLIWGHSHAGQVFALLTVFLAGGEQAQALYDFIDKHPHVYPHAKQRLQTNLAVMKDINLDFAIFGTPIRYRWGRYDKFRLVPIVNHRSNSSPLPSAVLKIEDGDYVQQWGIDGTDAVAPNLQREAELSEILENAGLNWEATWQALERERSRREPKYVNGNSETVAANVCVDYQDNRVPAQSTPFDSSDSSWLKICDAIPLIGYSTGRVFGHGVYTTKCAMRFNTELVIEKLYRNAA